MTLGSIFGISLAFILTVVIVVIAVIIGTRYGAEEVVSAFFVGFLIFLITWSAISFTIFETDAFAAKSISWAEYNISKLEQKIENSNKEYDIIRYQTKIQKWKKNKEYYFNQIKENNENLH